jgi:hypothetical protein
VKLHRCKDSSPLCLPRILDSCKDPSLQLGVNSQIYCFPEWFGSWCCPCNRVPVEQPCYTCSFPGLPHSRSGMLKESLGNRVYTNAKSSRGLHCLIRRAGYKRACMDSHKWVLNTVGLRWVQCRNAGFEEERKKLEVEKHLVHCTCHSCWFDCCQALRIWGLEKGQLYTRKQDHSKGGEYVEAPQMHRVHSHTQA